MEIFDYDQILLLPRKCRVNSRSECDTSVEFGPRRFKLPVVPANMKTVIDEALCAWLAAGGEPGWWVPCAFTAVAWLAFLAFFRDPPRRAPASSDGCMLAPADGLVSAVFEQPHHDAIGGPALVIRIFLSVLDVHVNRVPWDGRVVGRAHHPGRYLDVRLAESAKVNENLVVTIETSQGARYAIAAAALVVLIGAIVFSSRKQNGIKATA